VSPSHPLTCRCLEQEEGSLRASLGTTQGTQDLAAGYSSQDEQEEGPLGGLGSIEQLPGGGGRWGRGSLRHTPGEGPRSQGASSVAFSHCFWDSTRTLYVVSAHCRQPWVMLAAGEGLHAVAVHNPLWRWCCTVCSCMCLTVPSQQSL
jgi:hypothetical protein